MSVQPITTATVNPPNDQRIAVENQDTHGGVAFSDWIKYVIDEIGLWGFEA